MRPHLALGGGVKIALGRPKVERHLGVVVDPPTALALAAHVDARGLELALLLQRREAAGLLELRLARLALGLFAARVGEARAGLGEHLLLVLVHVDGVGARGAALGVGVDVARAQAARVVAVVVAVLVHDLVPAAGWGGLENGGFFCLSGVFFFAGRACEGAAGVGGEGSGGAQEALVALEALLRGAAHHGRNGAPLRGHDLGQVQQLLILLTRPLGLFDAGVEPLVPARLALLGGLAGEEGGDAGPLVEAILHHRGLEDLVLQARAM